MLDGWHAMWGMHWLGWLFWVLLLVLVMMLIRRAGWGAAPPGETALEVLRRRYAAGEISTQEFEERKARLEGNADPPGARG